MASSGKKGKKSKGKTVPLTDFLQETHGVSTIPIKKYNWSDEVEDALDGYESRPKSNVSLPTAPRAARGPDISEDRIPSNPPFIAYISNLPYDIEEEDIESFFSNMNISSMRLPRDGGGEGGKLKGFGYVEFEDRGSLVEAISILDTNLKGRRIKIDVATNSDTDRRRGGRMDIGRDRPERPEVTMGDWRSGPRDQPTSDSRDTRGGGGFNRDRERDKDREGPPESNRAGAWRENVDRPSFKDDREPRSYRESDRDRDRGGSFRDSERDRGGGFSDRSRFADRDNDRRPGGFGPRRNYGDREGYDREGGFSRREDGGPPTERDQQRSRPKLMLAPRTKPIDEQSPVDVLEKGNEPVSAPVPAVSIFGAAKPVDTSARERQIEERLAKEKDVRAPSRDESRDNKRDSEEERAPKREAWGRKRNDESDDSGRRESPERRPSSRAHKNDDKKSAAGQRDRSATSKEEKTPPKKEEKLPRDNHDKEMPKLKEPEPPNFAASNKFATLEADDFSD